LANRSGRACSAGVAELALRETSLATPQTRAKQVLPLHNPVFNTGVVAELARLIDRLPFVGIIRIETKKCNFILGNNVKKLRKIRNIRSTADIMPFW